MQVPDEYPTLRYSACGSVCAAFNADKAAVLVGTVGYLMREIDVYPFTSKRSTPWEACFRIEKHFVRAALYTSENDQVEVHVTVALKDCWKVCIEEVPICTDSSCSEDGLMFVQQRPTKMGVHYTFNHDPAHTVELECPESVPNEPLFLFSSPAGAWVYMKLKNMLYIIKTRTFIELPFSGMLEWMDDTHSVICVETPTGFRELWRYTQKKKWELVKRIDKKFHVDGLPVRYKFVIA